MSARRWARRIGLTLLAVPTVGGTGTWAYIQYRESTRPPEHVFEKIVSSNGELMLRGCKHAAPTTVRLTLRFFELVFIFLPLLLFYPFVTLRDEWLQKWLDMVLRSMERAGPAFVKCGQWACTRRDLFPQRLRETLEQLYSEISCHPFADTKRIIEEETGKPLAETFRSIDPVPIGSGSIGQVHAAVTVEGRKVVVKVMHPNVVETIAKDFYLLNKLARIVERMMPSLAHYELQMQALAWTNHLAAQLDFRTEAEHLTLFRKHFAGTDYVTFPEPLMATQRILVETYAAGEPATEQFLKSQPEAVRDVLAEKGLNCFLKMMLRDNFLHGDLHPGNILVDTTTNASKPIITLIDVGLCTKLTKLEGEKCGALLGSFVYWKPPMCVDALLSMGHTQKYVNREKFVDDTAELFQHYRPAQGDEERVVTNILESMFDVMRANKLTMEPVFVSVMWACLVLESFIMALNPEYNMVMHSAPWLVSEGFISGSVVRKLARRSWLNVKNSFSSAIGSRSDAEASTDFKPKRRKKFEEIAGKSFVVAESPTGA